MHGVEDRAHMRPGRLAAAPGQAFAQAAGRGPASVGAHGAA